MSKIQVVRDSSIPSTYVAVPQTNIKDLWVGSLLYKYSNKLPSIAFANGWTKTDGYDDIITHTTVDQGRGSNWISCTTSHIGGDGYGSYVYQICLMDGQHKAVDVNAAFQRIEKKRNPHAHQEEVAIYKRILPEEVIGVWVPVVKLGKVPKTYTIKYNGTDVDVTPWDSYFEYYLKKAYLSLVKELEATLPDSSGSK